MQTKQRVRLHPGTVVQMFYAIAPAIKGTLSSWGQSEPSYFRHLRQAGAEPRHLGSPSERLSPTAAGWPLALDPQLPVGAQISPSPQGMGFVRGVGGGERRRKSHQGPSDPKTPGITPRRGAFRRRGYGFAPPPPAEPLSGQQCLLVSIQFKCCFRVN